MVGNFMKLTHLSHAQRVCRLYKKACRTTQAYYPERTQFRYHVVILRDRFEQNKNLRDMIAAKKLLEDGERELWKVQHPQPLQFGNSPGGSSYGREAYFPDALLDMWHPLEKAQYPEYFARREKRKAEYVERWEQKWGVKAEPDHH